jgi:hypothetical protein
MKRFSVLLLAILLTSLADSSGWASTYNPQADFAATNPNGVWSYGLIDPSANFSLLTPYSANNDQSGVNSWGTFPGIFDNTNSSSTTIYTTIVIPAETLLLHPPNSADQTDLRFTAPLALTVSNITATFAAGSNTTPTSSDVHVYIGGVDEFDDTVNANAGGGATTFNSGPLHLYAGETVEFRVGDGGNGYSFDGTTLVASISAIPAPEPSSLVAFGGLGLAGLIVAVRRRRKTS